MTRGHPVLCSLFRGNDKPSREKTGEFVADKTENADGILPIRRYDAQTRHPACLFCIHFQPTMVSYALFVAFFAKNGIIEGVRLALGDLLFANESMMRLLICLFSIVDIINLELLIVLVR